MAIANPPQVSEPSLSSSFRPGKKIFLAACIILIGAIVAVINLRDPIDFLDHRAFDPKLISAPLPSNAKTDKILTKLDSAKVADKPSLDDPAKKTAEKVDINIPVLAKTPKLADNVEKYAQAYPQPILIVDESILDHSADNKTGSSVKKKEEIQAPKPFVSVNTEFKPIHQFKKLQPAQIKDLPKDIRQPNGKPAELGNDELLTLFDFAENIGPMSEKAASEAMPENPFGSTGFSSASSENVGVSTVFDPDATIMLIPLQPLAAPKTQNDKTKGTPPSTNSLQPLPPLQGDISSRQNVGASVRLTIHRF